MRRLPERPDLDQLHHQARELQRASEAGLPLSQAQLALAREYGFASWPRLKAEVDLRRALRDRSDEVVTVRPVGSVEELRTTHRVIAAQFPPRRYPPSHGIELLVRRFEEDRGLSVVAEVGGRILGGLLGVRLEGAVKVASIALVPEARRHGVGSRLMRTMEAAAVERGLTSIYLGAVDEGARDFYRSLGFSGRRSLMRRSLPSVPPSGEGRRSRLEELRLRRAERLGRRNSPVADR